MLHRIVTLSALVVAMASSLSAQEVTFRGKVEDVSGTGGFVVGCTSTTLSSPGIDLNPFVGTSTEITGTWNGSVASPAVTVTAIQGIPELFEIGGSGRIGDELGFGVTATPGDFAILFAGIRPTFVPTTRSGALFLDPRFLFRIGSGLVPGGGQFEIKVGIPDDPALVDLDVLGQAFVAFQTGESTWSNPDCKTIES